MKKFIKYFIFIVIISVSTTVNAAIITIDEVVDKFHNSTMAKTSPNELRVTYTDTHFFISEILEGPDKHVTFTRTENILSITIDNNDTESVAKLPKVVNLIDVVGQLHGYKEGELANTFNSNKISDYTLSKEGLEVTTQSTGRQIIKLDITKKVPLIEYKNLSFEKDDFTKNKEDIAKTGSYTGTKGNLYLAKTFTNNQYKITIGERFALTKCSYNSLLAILEIIFEDNEVVLAYFKKYYPEITSENKSFSGISIEINPQKTTQEQKAMPEEHSYYIMRITINKDTIIAAANTWEYNESSGGNKGSTPGVDYEITEYDPNNSSKVNEKKSIAIKNIIIIAIIAIIIIILVVIVIVIIKNKKNKEDNQLDQY